MRQKTEEAEMVLYPETKTYNAGTHSLVTVFPKQIIKAMKLKKETTLCWTIKTREDGKRYIAVWVKGK